MKSRREHVVPLSAQAKEVVNQIPPVSRDLVFPGSKPGKPLSDNTLRIALHRMGFEVTAHGFRTLASTSLNEIGFPPDIIEAQLAHLPADRTRAAYNRAEYMEQRREMMQTWADVVSNKVVPFKRIQQTVRRS
jgi:integrase